ncbi:DEAD/DEAH box helicase family protein [Helicobacter japonicus]|uniref:DEAD/DEAH box helicase family protein n=1 Tax=Helicobacter japonicus TaxID=425400 RepID=UPI0023F21A8B|nr:DEAD/DEAH box helicase family protein [Helicobacter japonicus]
MEKKMSENKLQEIITREYGKRNIEKIEIPAYITQNLSRELREYQKEALKLYLAQRELCADKTLQGNHLMFNMATGSGKTLIMAALMLHCYKNGYRYFVFFVNSINIIEKTKSNFCDSESEKYLFAKYINIDNKRVSINAVNNFNEAREDCVNIVFSSVQGLYSLFTQERENAITFADLQGQKIVYLADEAHHLNSETKSYLKGEEAQIKESWEGVIKKAFEAHSENLMLEFTATIPNHSAVQEKYRDKIVFEYNLKQFSADKYSKRIYLLQYNGIEKQERFLGSCVLNIYRMLLAQEHNVFLKPVVLYKSKTIKESKENEEAFKIFIKELDSMQIAQFLASYAHLSKGNESEQSLFFEAQEFFERKKIDSKDVCVMIQELFSEENVLNVNEDKQLREQQILLNCLESKSNEVRAIFAVDKLNEGWDVLNLFDIVRLSIGLKQSDKNKITLKVKKSIKEGNFYNLAYFATNKRYKKSSTNTLFSEESVCKIIERTQDIKIPLIEVKGVIEDEMLTKEIETSQTYHRDKEFLILSPHIIAKAMNKLSKDYSFDVLSAKFNAISKQDFIEKYLSNLNIKLHSRQSEEGIKIPQIALKIAIFVLEHFAQSIHNELDSYEVGRWEVKPLSIISDREMYRDEKNSDVQKEINYEWFIFDTFVGNELEIEFLDFIESQKELVNKHFSQWLIVRNERFAECVVYDDRKKLENGEVNKTYAQRFEPDFYFLGKRVGEVSIICQCIIEPKAEHLVDYDKWKEEFLENLLSRTSVKTKNICIDVNGMPFYKKKNNEKFREKFENFVKK